MVSYTPTETSNTSYLKDDAGGNGTGDMRTVPLEFILNTATNKWKLKLP